MFTEESGTDLTVTVQGEQYHAEATADVDSDGVDDTAIVPTDRGAIAFTDTDADGQADLMTELDVDGETVGQATYDSTTGEWVRVDHPQDLPATSHTSGDVEGSVTPATPDQGAVGGTMTADLPGGDADLGAPTHDTDDDGVDDSVVVTSAAGNAVIFTDADEDGDADFVTEITKRGEVTVSEHAGDGEWTVIERGHLDDRGDYHVDTSADAPQPDESGWATSGGAYEVHIDPRTGTWTNG